MLQMALYQIVKALENHIKKGLRFFFNTSILIEKNFLTKLQEARVSTSFGFPKVTQTNGQSVHKFSKVTQTNGQSVHKFPKVTQTNGQSVHKFSKVTQTNGKSVHKFSKVTQTNGQSVHKL